MNAKKYGILVEERKRSKLRNLRFGKKVKALLYYEPKSYSKAAKLYEKRKRHLENKGGDRFYCFLKAKIVRVPLAKPKTEVKSDLDNKFKEWRKNYYAELQQYENVEFKEENNYIEQIQMAFHNFPCSEEFDYVFRKFRQLRELMRRVRNFSCVQLTRKLIGFKRLDLAQSVIEYIEKDSLFLDSIELLDFVGISPISNTLFAEMMNYLEFPDDEEVHDKWLSYLTFFTNPQGEFMRLRHIWEETYLNLLNSCILQSIIDDENSFVRSLMSRRPVKNCKEHPSFNIDPYQRVDSYFSRRGMKKCPIGCDGHKGNLLLLMINLKRQKMVRKLLQHGIPISSSSCGGNIRSMVWEVTQPEEPKKLSLDLEDDNFDLEEYIRRKEEEEEKVQKDSVIPYDDFDAHIDFDNTSFDSDEEEEHIMKEFEEYEDPEEAEPIYELKCVYSRNNAISCAVQAADNKLLDYIISKNVNPFQNNDAAIRAIGTQRFLKLLSNDFEDELTLTARKIINKAELLLVERANRMKRNTVNRRINKGTKALVPWQLVHAIILAQSFLEAYDDQRHVEKNLNSFLENYLNYFLKNAPATRGRTLKRTLNRQNSRSTLDRAGTALRLTGSRSGTDSGSESGMSSHTVVSRISGSIREGWGTLTRKASRASKLFRHYGRKKRRTIVSKVSPSAFNREFDETRLTESQPRASLYKFRKPKEEYYFRITLAVDYLIREEKMSKSPSVRILSVILYLLNHFSLLLDKERMVKISKFLVKAVTDNRYGARNLLLNTLTNHHVLQCFLSIKPAAKRRSVDELRFLITSEYFQKALEIDYESAFKYKKRGRRVLIGMMITLGKSNEDVLLASIIGNEEFKFRKAEVMAYYKGLERVNPDAAEYMYVRYAEYFDKV